MTKTTTKSKPVHRAVITANLIDGDGNDLYGNTGTVISPMNGEGWFVFKRDDGRVFNLYRSEFHDPNTDFGDTAPLNPKYSSLL